MRAARPGRGHLAGLADDLGEGQPVAPLKEVDHVMVLVRRALPAHPQVAVVGCFHVEAVNATTEGAGADPVRAGVFETWHKVNDAC